MIQRHSQLPQGSSGILRDEARPEVVVAESSQRADPGSLLRPMRHGPSPIRSQRIGGELVLWSFKDFPRIFQGFSKDFQDEGWRANEVFSLQELICIDMYHPQLPMRALVKRRPIWQIIDGWNSFPFIRIPLLLYQSSIFVAMRQTSLSWIATTRWEQCQPMPSIYYCYFAVVDVRWFSGCEPFTNPSWANRGGKTRWSPLWFASSRSFRRRALLATTGAGAKCERNGNGRPETVKLVFTKKVKLKSPGRCLLVEHRHLKVLTAVFRDDLLHRTRRENWCGLRLSDAGRRLQATNCIKQVRWWNCFLVERFASFWDLPGYWYPLCIAHLLPPLTNPWDHLDSEKSWECHGGYPQLSSIFSDFLGFSMK